MSLSVTTDVFCDGGGSGCRGWTEGAQTSHRMEARAARQAARLKGWRCRDGRDLCPPCARKEDR